MSETDLHPDAMMRYLLARSGRADEITYPECAQPAIEKREHS